MHAVIIVWTHEAVGVPGFLHTSVVQGFLSLQSASLEHAGVAEGMHFPFSQTGAVLGQIFPHEPQLLGSVNKLVSHLFAALPSQFAQPAGQLTHVSMEQ